MLRRRWLSLLEKCCRSMLEWEPLAGICLRWFGHWLWHWSLNELCQNAECFYYQCQYHWFIASAKSDHRFWPWPFDFATQSPEPSWCHAWQVTLRAQGYWWSFKTVLNTSVADPFNAVIQCMSQVGQWMESYLNLYFIFILYLFELYYYRFIGWLSSWYFGQWAEAGNFIS